MPSKSKQQQKFMGIVRAIQKGDQPASKFSKKAQDAADDMKKKDVEKFASTKHKGLPKKVEQALREKIRTMVEDYVESCGYVVSAKDPNYKLKSPGGTGEEDRELKDEGFGGELPKTEKKKFEKERLENAEVLGYTLTGTKDLKEASTLTLRGKNGKLVDVPRKYASIISAIDRGMSKFNPRGVMFGHRKYHKLKPNDEYSGSIILKNPLSKKDISDVMKQLKRISSSIRFKFEKVTFNSDRNEPFIEFRIKSKQFNESMNPSAVKKMRAEFEKTGQLPPHLKKFALDLKILKKKHKVKNIVVPGLEWMSDMKEQSVPGNFDKALGKLKFNQFTPTNVKRISKRFKVDYKDAVEWIKLNHVINVADKPTMAESINEDGHTDVASAKRKVMIMVDDSNKLLNKLNGMNKEDSLPSWWSDKITLSQNYLEKATNYLLNPVESINEARLNPKETIQQLGGNRFLYMVGAKNLAVDKSRNELHMKIMRNAKGVSHVVVRLTSLDLYDMKFLSIRAGKIRVKATEKGVYGDQLATFFKKHTGLNTRL